jgi:excisionase family DNA binding protein
MSVETNARTTTASTDLQTLTVDEAAAVLRVNVKTLYAEIAAGRFPAIRLGRAIRISRAVVVSTLEQGRIAMPRGRDK